MNILVLLKQVPNPDLQFKINDRGTDIRRENLTYRLNGADEYALEEAVRLREKHGGRIVALGMGPERVNEVLRGALAKGADEAVRVAYDDPIAFDAGANGSILAAVARGIPFDLILTGVQSDDYAHAATGGVLAGNLGIPLAAVVTKVEVKGQEVEVHRELEGGVEEVCRLKLPALLTVQFGINQPRYASVAAILRASRAPIKAIGPSEVGVGSWAELVGPPRVALRRLSPPLARGKAEMIEGTPEEAGKRLAQILREKGFVRVA
jgi:electron transfer flavoprotein beta subunit